MPQEQYLLGLQKSYKQFNSHSNSLLEPCDYRDNSIWHDISKNITYTGMQQLSRTASALTNLFTSALTNLGLTRATAYSATRFTEENILQIQ